MSNIKKEAEDVVEKFKRWQFQAQPTQQRFFAKQCAIVHLEQVIKDWVKNEDIAGKFEVIANYQQILNHIKNEM